MKNNSSVKSTPVPNTAGYPEKDVNKNDVPMFGRYLPGTKQKTFSNSRGGGAAKRGFGTREVTSKD